MDRGRHYSQVSIAHILPRATDVIWLDYSLTVIMARVLRRSLLRSLSGRELWPGTGNREDFGRWLRKDHPIRWRWDTYRSGNQRRAIRLASPALAHLPNAGSRRHGTLGSGSSDRLNA